jgi:hypothetical protein
MTGEEITNQIIEDLASSLKAQNNTRSNAQIMDAITAEAMNPGRPSTFSISESRVAMLCEISLSGFCMSVIQIISCITTIIDLQENQRLTVAQLHELFTQKRQRIAEAIQHIKENNNHRFRDMDEALFNFLEERVQIIHKESEEIRRAYQSYLQEQGE